MQNFVMGIAGAVLFAAGVVVGTGVQDGKKPSEQDAKKPAAEQDSAMPGVKPTAEHAVLAREAGVWAFKQKMLDPSNGQWAESTGTETIKMDCGGLWSCAEFDCTGGVNKGFRGRGITGFDPAKKQYVGLWVDSTTASPFVLVGAYDAAKKRLVMDALGTDPNGNEIRLKMTTTTVDEKNRRFAVSMDQGGKDFEIMTIEYVKS